MFFKINCFKKLIYVGADFRGEQYITNNYIYSGYNENNCFIQFNKFKNQNIKETIKTTYRLSFSGSLIFIYFIIYT